MKKCQCRLCRRWRQHIPLTCQKLHTQQCSITSQETGILNYTFCACIILGIYSTLFKMLMRFWLGWVSVAWSCVNNALCPLHSSHSCTLFYPLLLVLLFFFYYFCCFCCVGKTFSHCFLIVNQLYIYSLLFIKFHCCDTCVTVFLLRVDVFSS